jgi:hypothetical protein
VTLRSVLLLVSQSKVGRVLVFMLRPLSETAGHCIFGWYSTLNNTDIKYALDEQL